MIVTRLSVQISLAANLASLVDAPVELGLLVGVLFHVALEAARALHPLAADLAENPVFGVGEHVRPQIGSSVEAQFALKAWIGRVDADVMGTKQTLFLELLAAFRTGEDCVAAIGGTVGLFGVLPVALSGLELFLAQMTGKSFGAVLIRDGVNGLSVALHLRDALKGLLAFRAFVLPRLLVPAQLFRHVLCHTVLGLEAFSTLRTLELLGAVHPRLAVDLRAVLTHSLGGVESLGALCAFDGAFSCGQGLAVLVMVQELFARGAVDETNDHFAPRTFDLVIWAFVTELHVVTKRYWSLKGNGTLQALEHLSFCHRFNAMSVIEMVVELLFCLEHQIHAVFVKRTHEARESGGILYLPLLSGFGFRSCFGNVIFIWIINILLFCNDVDERFMLLVLDGEFGTFVTLVARFGLQGRFEEQWTVRRKLGRVQVRIQPDVIAPDARH